MTSADPEIVELINRCKAKSAGTVLLFDKREIHIADDRIEEFWLGYCSLIDSDKQRNFFLSETYSGAVPITIEGVIRFPKSYSHKVIITKEFISELIRAYQLAISEKLVLTKKGKKINQLYAVYCQSDSFANDTAAAFRLQFPWCRIAPEAHKKIILPQVIDELKRRKSLDQLREHPKSDWDEILDERSINNTLPLYGSLRLPGVPRVVYQNTYEPGKGLVGDESDDADNMSEEDMSADGMSDEDYDKSLPEIKKEFPFDFRAHPLATSGLITKETFREYSEQTTEGLNPHWLPLCLSLTYYSKAALLIDENFKDQTDELDVEVGEFDPEMEAELELASQLLGMIKESRKKQPVYWRKIGMCLYTISEGDNRGLNLWLESCGGDRNKAEKLYNEFANNHRSIKTLAFYARIDSKTDYQLWHDEWAGEALETAMASLDDHDIAYAFYRYYWLDFICFGQTNKKWYIFRNHKWHLTTDAIEVSRCMSTKFIQEIIRFRARLSAIQADEKQPKKKGREKLEERSIDDAINNIGKLKARLKKNAYKTTLIKEACKHFHDERFDEIMNKDIPFLFPHTNCVVEVDDETKKCIIRPGEPEDHINRNTGARLENYNIKSPIVQELLEWLEQLFPDESLRHEFMKWLASCIRGPNMDKKCTMLTGPSNGGKTTLFKTIALAMGPFYVTWEASDLLRATSPGAANPSVAKARYAKLVAIEEVGKNTVIAGELLKKITGNGKMNGRELFTQGENGWVANFKFAMAFNESKPKIDDADEAAMMRMMPFPMGSRWVWKLPGWSDTLKEGEKNKIIEDAAKRRIFKADRFFDNKLPALARALAWYMVYYYPIYAEEGLKDHETIKNMVDSYWRELDDYGQFMDEVMEPITTTSGKPNTKAIVPLDEAYQEFLTWYSQANSGFKQKPPKKNEFKKEMEKDNHLGELDTEIEGWRGWAFKQGGAKKKRKLNKSPTKGG